MTTATNSDLAYLRAIVLNHSNNVLEPERDYLFQTRLSVLLRDQGITQLTELVQRLRSGKNPQLERAIAEAMTINETSFFRDSRPFELLRRELLPKLIEARRFTRRLRIWSAACSTGQEALSVAMLLREYFTMQAGWDIRIEGTDIASSVIRRARQGCYHRIEINRGLPARCIVRYFEKVDEDWVAKPEIHDLCHFRQENLCSTPPFRDIFDVILLRNVMLYFSQETRCRVLETMHRLLASDGVLLLGSAEQPANPTLWTPIVSGGTCYFRPASRC